MTNNQIPITKQNSIFPFGHWLLNIEICLELARQFAVGKLTRSRQIQGI
jgi:hypothetical protein